MYRLILTLDDREVDDALVGSTEPASAVIAGALRDFGAVERLERDGEELEKP